MDIYQITVASRNRMPLFADEAQRRSALHLLARIGGARLLLFNLVDDHFHAIATAARAAISHLAQALSVSLGHLREEPLAGAHISAVETRLHLVRLVSYVLRQGPHHGLEHEPALWTGSCFQDLAGARWLPGLSLRLRAALPRLRLREIFAAVGLPQEPLVPASLAEIADAGPSRLVSAAAAALAADPALRGQPKPVVLARHAASRLALLAGFTSQQMAQALSVSRRTVQRLASQAPAANITTAVALRLALENRVNSVRRSGPSPGARNVAI
jgi:hypothetical protein